MRTLTLGLCTGARTDHRLANGLAAGSLLALATLTTVVPLPASAQNQQSSVTYTKRGASYDDVRADLQDAIIKRGLKVDYIGNIAAMLKRTGADVGSNQPVYDEAEYFTFCSAKLSRAMMEADAAAMAQCPYVMFAYKRAGGASEIVVGYRRLPVGEVPRAAKAFGEINSLLDEIAKDATK